MFRSRAWIEQPAAQEFYELVKFSVGQRNWVGYAKVEPREHRFNWPHRTSQVDVYSGQRRIVIASLFDNVEMEAKGVSQIGECAVVEESWLQRQVPKR